MPVSGLAYSWGNTHSGHLSRLRNAQELCNTSKPYLRKQNQKTYGNLLTSSTKLCHVTSIFVSLATACLKTEGQRVFSKIYEVLGWMEPTISSIQVCFCSMHSSKARPHAMDGQVPVSLTVWFSGSLSQSQPGLPKSCSITNLGCVFPPISLCACCFGSRKSNWLRELPVRDNLSHPWFCFSV